MDNATNNAHIKLSTFAPNPKNVKNAVTVGTNFNMITSIVMFAILFGIILLCIYTPRLTNYVQNSKR